MYPMPPGHARAPFLLVNQFFDHTNGDGSVVITTTGQQLWTRPDQSWYTQAANNSGSRQRIAGNTYRIGTYAFTTGTVSGDMMAVGIDVGESSLVTPSAIALASHVYRWDWWFNLTSVASINVQFGLSDAPLGTQNNTSLINLDTNVDAFWHFINTSGGTQTNTASTVTATADWHKATGIQAPVVGTSGAPMGWHYYVDDVLIGVDSTNMPVTPVTVAARVRTRTAAAKTLLVDHCQVWTDGAAMVSGGVP